MRHQVFGKRLSRDTKARKALLNNLANSLLLHEKITTTTAKAKFAKSHIEKMVTVAKKDRLAQSRILASSLNKEAFLKLKDQIAPGFAERSGGYTRIIRLSPRRGDMAPMARLEFVKWEKQIAGKSKPDKKSGAKVSSNKTEGGKRTTKKPIKKKQKTKLDQSKNNKRL